MTKPGVTFNDLDHVDRHRDRNLWSASRGSKHKCKCVSLSHFPRHCIQYEGHNITSHNLKSYMGQSSPGCLYTLGSLFDLANRENSQYFMHANMYGAWSVLNSPSSCCIMKSTLMSHYRERTEIVDTVIVGISDVLLHSKKHSQ